LINLSIIVPGIRPNNWVKLFNELNLYAGDVSFEIIFIGPHFPPNELSEHLNVRYIRDFGSPARCLQLAAGLCTGEKMCWIPDDIIISDNTLFECYKILSDKPVNDGMTLRYSEGPGFTGNQPEQEEYWIGYTHADQQLPGVDPTWKIAPIFMYDLKYFIEIGGLDCKFEHVNINTHDLAYRIQNNGGVIHSSPRRVLSADWEGLGGIVQSSYHLNDLPLFQSIYSQKIDRYKIDFDNWKSSPSFWDKRYTNK